MMGLAIDLAMDEDRSEVFLAMTDEEGVSVEGLLDAADLDDLIQRLGVMRAALADAVPERLEPSARVAALRDPSWWCQPRAEDYGVCFRHPGLGWRAVGLPPHEAKKLAEWLVKDRPDAD